MPVKVEAMRVTGPVKPKTDHNDVTPSCKKPPMLTYALQRHIIGRSCPELRSSCIAPELNEDINFHTNLQNTEKEDAGIKNGLIKAEISNRQLTTATDFDVRRQQKKFCHPLRIPGREGTLMGFQLNRKSCEEVVMIVNGLFDRLHCDGMLHEEDEIRLSKYLLRIKAAVCSTKVTDPKLFQGVNGSASARNCVTMIMKLVEHDCLGKLVSNVELVGFEDRKIISLIFCNTMRRQWVINSRVIDYMEDNSYLMMTMLEGYKTQSLSFTNGKMLRECFRFPSLVKIMLNSKYFHNFFSLVQLTAFEISSDAFMTLKILLTEHKSISAAFLENNYDKFFASYGTLLESENYVTKLSSLRFLSTLLLDPNFYSIMTLYVLDIRCLKQIMTIMAEGSATVSFAAYQTFKVFAVNPEASLRIAKTLMRNKTRILAIIEKLTPPQDSEGKFEEEVTYLKKHFNVEIPKILAAAAAKEEKRCRDSQPKNSERSGSKSEDSQSESL